MQSNWCLKNRVRYTPHVGWHTGGKGGQGGNITYEGPPHPNRPPIKGQGVLPEEP